MNEIYNISTFCAAADLAASISIETSLVHTAHKLAEISLCLYYLYLSIFILV